MVHFLHSHGPNLLEFALHAYIHLLSGICVSRIEISINLSTHNNLMDNCGHFPSAKTMSAQNSILTQIQLYNFKRLFYS